MKPISTNLPWLVATLVLATWPASASQVFLQRVEQIGDRIQAVWHVKVLEAKRHDDRMKLKDGSDGPVTSMHWSYQCEVVAAPYGPGPAEQAKPVTLRFTQIVPVKYDEHGKKVFHFSYESPITGLESQMKPGAEYLACLSYAKPVTGGWYPLMRSEPLERREALLDGIAQARAWKHLNQRHADWKDRIEIAAFDPKVGLLLMAQEDDRHRLALVPLGEPKLLIEPSPLTQRIIQLYADPAAKHVIARMRDGRIWYWHLSRFKERAN